MGTWKPRGSNTSRGHCSRKPSIGFRPKRRLLRRVATHTPDSDTLHSLARARGYTLKETRTRTQDRPDSKTWHLRLRLYDDWEGDERARLSIWENGADRETIALTTHADEPALERGIERWLDQLPDRLGARRAPA